MKIAFFHILFYCKPSSRKLKDTKVTLMYFVRLFNETITPKEEAFFTNYMSNIAKIDEIREELSTFHFMT